MEAAMHRSLIASFAMAVLATPLLAAGAEPWPWKAKAPVDPALATLSHVEDVTAAVDDSILTIAVKAVAPAAGYSELTLTPRLGDPDDRIFAFDVRGRAPQEIASQVLTPVTLAMSYADAPLSKLDRIEVYADDNCMAFSIKDKEPTDCVSKAMPQKPGALP
jgi:hypothetical protein